MKVYVVTSGKYSDYEIEAVFSTRELADAHIALLFPSEGAREDYNAQVQEWEVDGFAGNVFRDGFCACFAPDGEITNLGSMRVLARPEDRSATPTEWPTGVTVCSLVSPEHAEELAIEKWQAWKRYCQGGNHGSQTAAQPGARTRKSSGAGS